MRKESLEAARYFMLATLVKDDAFSEVPATVLEELVSAAVVTDLRKGATIFDAGDRPDRLSFVIDGCVAFLASGEDHKERLYEQASPGQFFGVSAMFDGEPEMARTTVISSKACCAHIDRAVVLALCKAHGTLAVAFAITLARRVRRTTSLLAAQMNLSAQERIARCLLTFAAGPGMTEALDPLPNLTQAQIGAAAGTAKDVAARTIGHFERTGALKRERGHIAWLHRERLREFARISG